jgi:hypothetical protein
MRQRRTRAWAAALTLLLGAGTPVALVASGALAGSPPDVTTAAYDNLRTGWDPNEPSLGPADVESASFGRVFTTQLKGAVYSQPLVVNGTVIVTTEEARAYGINATTGAIEWRRDFGTPLLASAIGCGDLAPDLGSTSTPVVDPSTDTVYLTTRLATSKGSGDNHTWLQAISASTGKEVSGFPVELQGTPDNTPGVAFADYNELQRPALLLLGGVVYMAFSSDCDNIPYRGVVMGVSTTTHAITAMWSDEAGVGTDTNSMSGIWQSGGGLVSDGPNQILLTTGNGIAPPPSAGGASTPSTLSESVLRLTVGSDGKLTPTDFFSPADAPDLDQSDDDLGSGAPVALPSAYFGTSADPDLLVQVGKDGRVFLLNRDDLGGREQGPGQTDDALQVLGPYQGVWGHPAVYGGEGGWVYILESAGGGNLQAFSYGVDGSGDPQLTLAGSSTGSYGYTSGAPEVTSNGTTAGSAVVWVVYVDGPTGKHAQLRAYGAIPSNGVLPLLWSAPIAAASKFEVPTASNGVVYVGSRTGKLYAFGLKSNEPLQSAPADFGSVPVGTSKTEDVVVTANRSTVITGVSPATGVVGVGGTTGTTIPNTGPGYNGSSVHPGTTDIGRANQVFSVRSPRRRTLSVGKSIAIPVTFTPRTAGPVVAQVTVQSTAGTRIVSLAGYGTAPGLQLSAPPLSFGTLDTGAGGKTLTFTVANSWDRPETITGVGPPAPPYAVEGLPRVGTVLAPEQAITASVAYDPSVAGVDNSYLTVASNHGSVSVPLTGAAATGTAHLTLAPDTLDFGSVPVGRSVTLTFHIQNTGNIPLVISRAAAPSGTFRASRPLPEGITLDPDTSVTQTVTFAPTQAGTFSGQYKFDAQNGQGPTVVTFTGMGTAP